MSDQTIHSVAGIVLAAGQSKRMGRAKLLLPWGATTVLGQTLSHVSAAGFADLMLVSGGYQNEIEQIADQQQVSHVHNSRFATGEMLSSLQLGVRSLIDLGSQSAGVLVMLGDLPFITTQLLLDVIEFFEAQAADDVIVAPAFDGRRGHPVIIGRAFWPDLLAIPDGGAPRDLFEEQRAATRLLPVRTDAILRDIDTPQQYEKWRP